MKNTDKYTDKDWEKLAGIFSGEETEHSDELSSFRTDDDLSIEKQWRKLGEMSNNNNKEINVDKAWNNTYSRIKENGLLIKTVPIGDRNRMRTFVRIAAMALIVIGVGSALFYLNNAGSFSKKVVIASNNDQRNIQVSLPDGSKVYLNRNSRLSYPTNLGISQRNVTLKGEAFFEITPDASKPFVIDAGKAKVKVLGTSFNVITNNKNDDIEVFVKTGKVMVSDNSGYQNLVLDPGFIGTMNSKTAEKVLNENPNYLSWNTDLLVFEGQTLDIVFADLKRVYNIDIVVDDPEILNKTLTGVFDKQPQDTLIRIICTTFNFSYEKEGYYYHLSKK
jgi:ferric-dicitrate binding protein FerR (iron transport regulator)